MATVTKARWREAQDAELRYWQGMELHELARSCAEKLEFWSQLDAQTVATLLDRKAVLEIGCGPLGVSLVSMSGYGERVTRLIKTDPLPPLPLADAQPSRHAWAGAFLDWIAQVARQGEYLQVAGENIAFDCAFDTVVTYNVLDHVHAPLAILRNARRALRPGGHLVVGVDCLSWLGQLRFERITRRRAKGSVLVEAHPHTFRPSQVEALIRSAGFRLLPTRGVPDWPRRLAGSHFRPTFIASK